MSGGKKTEMKINTDENQHCWKWRRQGGGAETKADKRAVSQRSSMMRVSSNTDKK